MYRMKWFPRVMLVAICCMLCARPTACLAQEVSGTAGVINSGDTSWLLVSAALVMLMTAPGLALFYGGLVRRKNVLSVLMQCMVALCLVSVQWIVLGYSLSFGPDHGGVIGDLSWFALSGVRHDAPSDYATTVPHQAFMVFQMMFAVIAPALIIGAFVERMRFGPFCVFIVLWSTLVYDPIAHWVWSKGGMLSLLNPTGKGALDFAGGTVVHVAAGMAALACALFLGKRKGYADKISPPHNLPFAVVGAGLLWFGWFGFNAGSALTAGGLATSAFVVTHTSAAVAGLSWGAMDWIFNRRPTVLGVITGIVAGLVAITPAAGFVNVQGAMLVGLGAGVVPWLFVAIIKVKAGYDDALDAFGVHGIGGVWGALATGLFATSAINATGSGAWDGHWGQLLVQFEAVGITGGYSFVMTLILLTAVDKISRIRATDHEEMVGLDLTQHREAAYTVIE